MIVRLMAIFVVISFPFIIVMVGILGGKIGYKMGVAHHSSLVCGSCKLWAKYTHSIGYCILKQTNTNVETACNNHQVRKI